MGARGCQSSGPFFRFPALQHPPEMVTYLGKRNVAIFSCDINSFDFKTRKSEQVVDNVMKKLDKLGKGIILMHDFQKHTAEALPTLLRKLKEGGYKVVAMRAKGSLQTLPRIRRIACQGRQAADRQQPPAEQRRANDLGITATRRCHCRAMPRLKIEGYVIASADGMLADSAASCPRP